VRPEPPLPLSVRLLGLACICACLATAVCAAQDNEITIDHPSRFATPDHPVRAVWIEAPSAELRTDESCRSLVEHARQAQMDDLFVEVRTHGDAYYNSDLVPPPAGLAESPFRDPLGSVIDAAHAEGERPIRVHAVLYLLALHDISGPFEPSEDHVAKRHPDWMSRDDLGNTFDPAGRFHLDPGAPAVVDHLEHVVGEIVDRYDVDGVHLAGFAYPGLDKAWGYSPAAIEAFTKEAGPRDDPPARDDPAWTRWRASRLTLLLGRLRRAILDRRDDVTLSISAIASGRPPSADQAGEPDFRRALQDWPVWCRAGLVDWLVLMNYRSNRLEQERFVEWMDYARASSAAASLLVGIGGSENFDAGVLMQVRLALGREVDGLMLHSYQRPALNVLPEADFLGFLGNTVFSPDYVLPHYVHEAILAAAPPPDDTFPDLAGAQQLPPPVPLDTADEPAHVWTQTDATRALLGEDVAEPVRPAEPITAAATPAQIPSVPDILHDKRRRVLLGNGQSFVGLIVATDGPNVTYQVNTVQVTLVRAQILESTPYEPKPQQ